jgi:hypothetical protein
MTTADKLRSEADLKGYHECTRAAKAMRDDAAGWRKIAADAAADPSIYGTRGETYAAGIAARYLLLAEFAEYEADQQQGYADSYWALVREGFAA